ncbi:hypothetical protein BKA69DRAFT_774415 [Paraphysoderma sedebokerense]|nr:hypothetical protein BKA69DRAFT_774415 [Paraphysoderma sedebokerense]
MMSGSDLYPADQHPLPSSNINININITNPTSVNLTVSSGSGSSKRSTHFADSTTATEVKMEFESVSVNGIGFPSKPPTDSLVKPEIDSFSHDFNNDLKMKVEPTDDFPLLTDIKRESSVDKSDLYITKTESPDLNSPQSPDSRLMSLEASAEPSPVSSPKRLANSAYEEALTIFTKLDDNEYKGKGLGLVDDDEAYPCSCNYEHGIDPIMEACGEDCINRTLFIECQKGFCPSGKYCQNRRFQKKQYAPVDIIKTEKKGFGLVTLVDLPPNTFVYEYIGEVITLNNFLKRTRLYSQEGHKHFYFMSLKKDEIIDATKRGCVARFINHSCNPNCATQKWIVGNRLRIGLFTLKYVPAGTELTFDYKFERYGAEAQTCYCGEPNCKGTIGTSKKDIDVSAIDDLEDDEEDDEMFSRKSKKKDYLETNDDALKMVRSVTRNLNSKPKKTLHLLTKLYNTNDREVLKYFLRFHGAAIMKMVLRSYKSDFGIVKLGLMIFEKLPITTRNTIDDKGLDPVMEQFFECDDTEIATLAKQLVESWKSLKTVYKIPKAPRPQNQVTEKPKTDQDTKKRPLDDEESVGSSGNRSVDNDGSNKRSKMNDNNSHHYRRDMYRSNSRPESRSSMDSYRPSRHNSIHSLNEGHRNTPPSRPPFPPPPLHPPAPSTQSDEPPLPPGWSVATTPTGQLYYYNQEGKTQWERPFVPPPSGIEGVSADDINKTIQQAMEARRLRQLEIEAEEEQQRKLKEEEEKAEKDALKQRMKEKAKEKEKRKREKKMKHKERGDDKSGSTGNVDKDRERARRKEKEKARKRAKENEHGKDRHRENGDVRSKDKSQKRDLMKKFNIKEAMDSSQGRELRKAMSAVIIKELSKNKGKFSTEVFKHQARKITHILHKKEISKHNSVSSIPTSVPEKMKMGIKKFMKDYVEKLIQRLAAGATGMEEEKEELDEVAEDKDTQCQNRSNDAIEIGGEERDAENMEIDRESDADSGSESGSGSDSSSDDDVDNDDLQSGNSGNSMTLDVEDRPALMSEMQRQQHQTTITTTHELDDGPGLSYVHNGDKMEVE